ncbi:helix-turn-helix transcriptional regulator [Pseudomonas sp. MSSRFD41]|uniref:LuxR C-terminal-related transcriptional regulator n=1 Tax=Pseudomonas sp. MSSRFD41 TaxID=1310370 RepID=UPI00163AF9CC|nr:LuxR C-terminal-related transcriptional regulator [Pseudomonas sp. MSSRFD41]MBC2655063.1 helix-turn-helix transcriptional regulator [Pseudomonas sp. MSSRFD41]
MTSTTINFAGFTGFLGRGAAPRELQCLMAIAGGASGKEVARALGISEDGVKKRLIALGTKWGVTRRAALVAEGFRRGVISPAAILAAILAVHGAVSDDQVLRIRRGGSEKRVELRVAARRVEQQVAA